MILSEKKVKTCRAGRALKAALSITLSITFRSIA
jgi:hypothetical protein